ncbi:MAG: GyrI-like domain-containing protein [Verrucomicrobiota bacterium]
MLDTPHLVQTEPQMAAMIHINVPSEQMQEVMCPAIMEVIGAAKAQGIGPAGPLFAHHYGMKPGIFNFDVGVPVSAAVEPVGRVIAGELPGAVVMRTLYTGPYEGLGDAWGDFQELVKAEGRALGPNLWERYLQGPETGGDPSTYVTELNQTIVI